MWWHLRAFGNLFDTGATLYPILPVSAFVTPHEILFWCAKIKYFFV